MAESDVVLAPLERTHLVRMARKVILEKQDKPGSIPEYLTVEEVAAVLNVSRNTVARLFEHLEGVIDLGTPERLHKRRRRILRISRRALERFIAERQVRRR